MEPDFEWRFAGPKNRVAHRWTRCIEDPIRWRSACSLTRLEFQLGPLHRDGERLCMNCCAVETPRG